MHFRDEEEKKWRTKRSFSLFFFTFDMVLLNQIFTERFCLYTDHFHWSTKESHLQNLPLHAIHAVSNPACLFSLLFRTFAIDLLQSVMSWMRSKCLCFIFLTFERSKPASVMMIKVVAIYIEFSMRSLKTKIFDEESICEHGNFRSLSYDFIKHAHIFNQHISLTIHRLLIYWIDCHEESKMKCYE